jgi:hypothetical protein
LGEDVALGVVRGVAEALAVPLGVGVGAVEVTGKLLGTGAGVDRLLIRSRVCLSKLGSTGSRYFWTSGRSLELEWVWSRSEATQTTTTIKVIAKITINSFLFIYNLLFVYVLAGSNKLLFVEKCLSI